MLLYIVYGIFFVDTVDTKIKACNALNAMFVKCHGMTESVKVHRKDQSVKDFTSKCLFLLFWQIACVSLISLIEI